MRGGEGCPRARERVGGWVLARRECVGAVRRSGDCLHPLSLSHSCPSSLTPSCSICPSPSLSSSLSTPSPILVLSLSYSLPLSCSLSHSATTLGSTQAGSQCVVSLRVVATLLSPFRLFLDSLSVASAASRRYDVLRRLSPIGRRDAVVNFPTIRAEPEESSRTPDP